MAKGGRVAYVPKDVLDTIGCIQKEKNIRTPQAFRELNNYANVGREVEKLKKRWFGL